MPTFSNKARVLLLARHDLYSAGADRVELFCMVNKLPTPKFFVVGVGNWDFDACAFYRPEAEVEPSFLSEVKMAERGYGPGINICLERCASPTSEKSPNTRNWNWPGSVTDRTPYGVLAHELGHHADWLASDVKHRYSGNHSRDVRAASGEPPVTAYAPDDGEWFAEVFRLFVTNHGLLKAMRPKAYALLLKTWKPVGTDDWVRELGANCPTRVKQNLVRRIATGR